MRDHKQQPWHTQLLLVLLLLNSSPSIQTVDYQSVGGGGGSGGGERLVQWKMLTKLNFSSQIRLHPHLLLLVTVPWSGESRSLMKEIAQVVTKKQDKFSTLKLMLVHRNSDALLADALGATEGIAIIYYHHSSSYKYQGRLRVQNILSSVDYLMSLEPEETPFKYLSTPGDLKMFLESTDRALLVLEFCGWTPKVLAKVKKNGSENNFGFNAETNETRAAEGTKNQKMENEKMNCGVETGFNGVPGLGEFITLNESDFLGSNSMGTGGGVSCSFQEFQQFELILQNLTTVAREFFLPPERLRYGVVTERLLLSSLGVGEPSSWLVILHFAGCPGCSKVLSGGEDLRRVLEVHASHVTEASLFFRSHNLLNSSYELKSDEGDLEPVLPVDKPSMILFIDRSSDSLNIRMESKAALDAFRELAVDNQISSKIGAQNIVNPTRFSSEVHHASKSISRGHRFEVSPLAEKIEALKDKISIMITSEGKQVNLDKVTSNSQGSRLNELLEYVLHHKKETRLSSLAKDAGFQLLSKDFDIKIFDSLPEEKESQSNQDAGESSVEDFLYHNVDHDKAQAPDMGMDWEDHVLSRLKDAEHSSTQDEKTSDDGRKQSHMHVNRDNGDQDSAVDEKVKETALPELENGGEHLHFTGFNGSFFFCDGQFRFLKALTGVSNIPSLVIIDPLSQQHYIFPDGAGFSYSLLSGFLDSFLNQSLLPYQRSETVILEPREASTPPFVNLDFHEVDSIPRVTSQAFFELVLGDASDSTHEGKAWQKDVLVLFSSSWCGFCQRMELVVREVYRVLKGYKGIMKSENNKSLLRSDDLSDTKVKLPLIYLMDCTRNDCSFIVKSMTQRELYPSLVLFPAEKKNAISYRGDMSVTDILKFIADHGNNSHWIFAEKGILRTDAKQGVRNQRLFMHTAEDKMQPSEASLGKEQSHEVLLKDRTQKVEVEKNQIKPPAQYPSSGTVFPVIPGTILIATDKLANVYPFDGSKILVLEVNQSTGFKGIIINKHISWNSFQKLEDGLELLMKAPLTLGGPIMINGMPLVTLSQKSFNDQHLEVVPDVYYLDQWATQNVIEGIKLGNESVAPYWFFLGYSSWGWDQLHDEIAEGAWTFSNGNLDMLDWPSGDDSA